MAGPATFQQYIKPAASMEDYHSLPNHLNMKNYSLAIAFGIAVVVVLASLASAQDLNKYTGKYDDVDIEAILNNDRLLNKYFECLIAEEESSCTADGKELKSKSSASADITDFTNRRSYCELSCVLTIKSTLRSNPFHCGGKNGTGTFVEKQEVMLKKLIIRISGRLDKFSAG